MAQESRLPVSLFLLRLGVFIVIFFWALDKIINPDHAAAVFANFYYLADMGAISLAVIGVIQIIVAVAFVIGFLRTWTYGLILLMHLISTLASLPNYLEPWDNLLFFAGWPMLAAIITLFLLRDRDTLLSMDEFLQRR